MPRSCELLHQRVDRVLVHVQRRDELVEGGQVDAALLLALLEECGDVQFGHATPLPRNATFYANRMRPIDER